MEILKKVPLLLSIFLGLFLASNFFMLFFYYLTPEFEWKSLEHQLKNYAENALLFFTIGFVVSVVFVFSIGWPLYLLGKFYSVDNYITSCLGGVAVTTVPYVVCVSLGWNIPSVTEKSGLIVFLVLVICGGVSGLIFHFIEKRKAEQKRS
ncbi:MAG: hypothetical protein K8J31_22655 [Anaerolineae bacterium]|nr:hypothetical protein [Anaerolineae bacterium]